MVFKGSVLYGQWRGNVVKVTVLDEESEDDTLAIAERLGHQNGMELKLTRLAAVSEEDMKRYMLSAEEHRITSYNVCYTKLLRIADPASG